jgi:Ca2+-binding EF-hand superfamily protein
MRSWGNLLSRDQLNDNTKAKNYFQQAEQLWEELVRDAPQYVQFQRFLGMIRKELEGLSQ